MNNASEQSKDSWFFNENRSEKPPVNKRSDISSDARLRERADVVIGSKSFISGTLQLDGLCVVDGTVEGEIASTGELLIGETGVVKARISGSIVRVFGRVVGDIDCQDRLELKTGAVVTGNISSRGLVIEDGVVFQGYCTMMQRSSLTGIAAPQGALHGDIHDETDSLSDVLELTRSVSSDTPSTEVSGVSTEAAAGSEVHSSAKI